jgi:hypothetical protein
MSACQAGLFIHFEIPQGISKSIGLFSSMLYIA